MKKTLVITFAAAGVFLTVCIVSVLFGAEENKPVRPMRVGVYDSRCITLAYMQAGFFKNEKMLKKLPDMLKEAEKKGDTKSVQGIEQELTYLRIKRHLQAFSTAPVHELLEPVKSKLSEVARQAGVEIIVSKWQIDYQSKEAEMIDVTESMLRLYVSAKDAAGIIDSIKNIEPISEDEGARIND